LWDLLTAGGDAVTPLPLDRGWDIEGLYDPIRPGPARFYSGPAGSCTTPASSIGLLGISPREALAMDPQQRLLLENLLGGAERAGIDPMTLRGSSTGVTPAGRPGATASSARPAPKDT